MKYFQSSIEYISGLDRTVWEIDVDSYDTKNIEMILEIYTTMRTLLIKEKNQDTTLITKILLGVFGFVPAFDTFFKLGFQTISHSAKCRFNRLNKKSLELVKEFYDNNKSVIDKLHNQICTIDFLTGRSTTLHYSKARIIDMYGYLIGRKIDADRKIKNANEIN